ncbi:endo alpha-1,4 polygalactosaminidase [Kocuria sp. CPCC 205268]|uniref:endo alpha-1,4 polygalactosaminidase n=1 Tax=Kocuria oxytropis TaxID=3058913 RepID=UPI0034D6164F
MARMVFSITAVVAMVAAAALVVVLLRVAEDRPPAQKSSSAQARPSTPGQLLVPAPGAQWQWQLRSTPELETGIDVYGMDGEETTEASVREFKKNGKLTICYLSAGTLETWRSDASRFPPEVVGDAMEDWADEYWLDVRRLDVLLPIMAARMDECASKGFDAVEPDNVDGYVNRTGFPLSPDDQLRYNRALTELAHERGLSIALKNDVDQITELEPYFDFAINEECFRHGECEAYGPFTAAGKAVLNVEYVETLGRCERARELGLSSMLKDLQLDGWRRPC